MELGNHIFDDSRKSISEYDIAQHSKSLLPWMISICNKVEEIMALLKKDWKVLRREQIWINRQQNY